VEETVDILRPVISDDTQTSTVVIYAIVNKVNGKKYIGSTINIERRIKTHFRELRRGVHYNYQLQRAFSKHGEDSFMIVILDKCSEINKVIYEQKYIDLQNFNCYNLARADVPLFHKVKMSWVKKGHKLSKEAIEKLRAINTGRECSTETRAKISLANKGRTKHNDEVRAKMSLTRKGRKHTDAARAKISEAGRGRVVNEETRAKISKANTGHKCSKEAKIKMSIAKKGKKISEEAKAKISVSLMGIKRHPLSLERRIKISEFQKTRKRGPCSEETKAKIRAANTGFKHSDEAKAKMSMASANAWKNSEHRAKAIAFALNHHRCRRQQIILAAQYGPFLTYPVCDEFSFIGKILSTGGIWFEAKGGSET
jgi:group I intron endonuclease